MPKSFLLSDPVLSVPSLIFALLGLTLLMLALTSLKRKRLFSATLHSSMAFGLISSSFILFLLAMNLHSYQRLSYEQPIAKISFTQIAPQTFTAKLEFANSENSSNYEMSGDEWQLDVRMVKWKAPATLLGLDARYRLERLSGRHQDIEKERSAARSIYALNQEQGLDLWSVLGSLKEYLPWIDAYYGSATYLPMADNAVYEILLSQSGLLARPMNEQGKTAIREWY